MFFLPLFCDKYINNALGIWISHQLIRGVFFWSLGAFCHLWQINVPKSARKLATLALGGVLIYLMLRHLHIARIFPLLEICMLIIILALARFLNHFDILLKRIPGNFPMFLYLFHALLVSILASFLTKYLSIGCAYYIFPLIMLGICTLFYLVISRIPVVFPFLTGELFYAKNSQDSKH